MSTSIGFVSTYPPTQCGLATFTRALRGALLTSGVVDAPVVQLLDAPDPVRPADVVAQIVMGDPASLAAGADALAGCDVVVVQHEFGIFGGRDGDEVLALMARVHVPCIVVLHTVLTTPTSHQRAVLQAVLDGADAVVTMSRTARERLLAGYRLDPELVSVIVHGAPDPVAAPARPDGGPFTVLTWGLLGPGKGIEWAVEAMGLLRDRAVACRYVVAGQTHPKVLQREGEAYRRTLQARVDELGLGDSVEFDGRYRDAASLARLVQSADVVLLPYDSTEQVTSGVLIEAVGAGRPVVATTFPHARELLAGGAGLLVDHRDPAAIATAVQRLATEPELLAATRATAVAVAPALSWSAVAASYRELVRRVLTARLAA